jgi:hypothetical protein
VHVEGRLEHPSRWLWLIKWVLAIPHFVALVFLWIALVVSAAAAFVAILFTGRYPRPLFNFNVGVIRWSWRVAFYTYGANGTDRYPPFSLAPVSDYPAAFDVEYPATQRRGLPLIGWWLAGIPQYVIVGLFAIGGATLGWDRWSQPWDGAPWIGLTAFLVLVAAVALTFRGDYPRSLFDFIVGLNRWTLRVVAYAALMTPEYPPFRLDAGEADSVATAVVPTVRPAGTAITQTAKPFGPMRVSVVVAAGLAVPLALAVTAIGALGIVLVVTVGQPVPGLLAFAIALLIAGLVLLYVCGTAVWLALDRRKPDESSVDSSHSG